MFGTSIAALINEMKNNIRNNSNNAAAVKELQKDLLKLTAAQQTYQAISSPQAQQTLAASLGSTPEAIIAGVDTGALDEVPQSAFNSPLLYPKSKSPVHLSYSSEDDSSDDENKAFDEAVEGLDEEDVDNFLASLKLFVKKKISITMMMH